MTGTIIVTGCASGLGLHTARNLLARPDASTCNYIFTIRPSNSSPTDQLQSIVDKFNIAQEKTSISAGTSNAPPKAQIKAVDLADLPSIRSFATDLHSQIAQSALPPVSALILNAGIISRPPPAPEPTSSTNDIEKHFMTNYLGNFALCLLLLGSLDKHARIVYISSWGHDPNHPVTKLDKVPEIQWRDDGCEQISLVSKWPAQTPEMAKLGGAHRYSASKLWLAMGMLALQKRLNADPEHCNISVVGLDPGGNLRTSIGRNNSAQERFIMAALGWYAALFGRWVWPNGLWRTESKTAQDIVNAALVANPLGQDPKSLYLNGSEVGKVNPEANDVQKQDKLWEASLRLADLKQEDTVLKL